LDQDTDGDGVPDANDDCNDTASGELVNSSGCSLTEDDGDGQDSDDDTGLLEGILSWEQIQAQYLSNIEAHTDGIEGELVSIDDGIDELVEIFDSAEAETGETAWSEIDPNTGAYSGELVEGEDYEVVEELSEKTWFTDFFDSNPLVSAFDDSGFDLTDSTCSMTLYLSSMGSHDLSLCEFESEFNLAGSVLLAFCSLFTLFMIVRN